MLTDTEDGGVDVRPGSIAPRPLSFSSAVYAMVMAIPLLISRRTTPHAYSVVYLARVGATDGIGVDKSEAPVWLALAHMFRKVLGLLGVRWIC